MLPPLSPPLPETARQYIRENPSVLEDLLRDMEAQGQGWMRQCPEFMVERLGLDPSQFDIDGFRNRRVPPSPEATAGFFLQFLYGLAAQPIDPLQLTADDRMAIRRLRELGNFSEEVVIRIYWMSLRNETLAARTLLDNAGRLSAL
jgi:hypothetical protein